MGILRCVSLQCNVSGIHMSRYFKSQRPICGVGNGGMGGFRRIACQLSTVGIERKIGGVDMSDCHAG